MTQVALTAPLKLGNDLSGRLPLLTVKLHCRPLCDHGILIA